MPTPKRTKKEAPTEPRSKSTYTEAAGERFCDRIRAGASQTEAARAIDTPRRTVRDWIKKVEGFRKQVEEAEGERNRALEERIFDQLSLLRDIEAGRVEVERLQLEALKLEIDTTKWMLSKLYAQKYGEKSQMEITGRDGADLLPRHTAEEIAQYAALVAAARAKIESHEQV